MPHIRATQEKLALRYGLTRQTALMLALLVHLPSVSPTTLANRMGTVDMKVLVSRLRARMRDADGAVVIRTARSFGYYLDATTRERLTHAGQAQILPGGAGAHPPVCG